MSIKTKTSRVSEAIRAYQEGQPEKIMVPEANLLKRIQSTLPPEIETRFKHLREKRQAETLTRAEHAELLTLLD